jgi:hypothetical protein
MADEASEIPRFSRLAHALKLHQSLEQKELAVTHKDVQVLAIALAVSLLHVNRAESTLNAYEAFNYGYGFPLSGQGFGGSGWAGSWSTVSGSGWTIGDGTTYNQQYTWILDVAGLDAVGSWDPSSAITSGTVRRSLSPSVGGAGKSLWISFVAKTDMFVNGDKLGIRFGNGSQYLTIGRTNGWNDWSLTATDLFGSEYPLVLSGVPVANQTLIVARVDFDAGAFAASIHVWCNPTLPDEPTSAGDMQLTGLWTNTISYVQLSGEVDSFISGSRGARIDEVRLGTTWKEVVPVAPPKVPSNLSECSIVGHTITLEAVLGDLPSYDIKERWVSKAVARSRSCRDKDGGRSWWQTRDDNVDETRHKADAQADDDDPTSSTAHAESGIQVTRSSKKLEITTYMPDPILKPTPDGCDNWPSWWRKHFGKARTVRFSKAKIDADVDNLKGGYWGCWGNCVTHGHRKRNKFLADPVDVELRNLSTGAVTRANVVTINSTVWDHSTLWTLVPGDPGYRRVISNTAQRMLFAIDVNRLDVPQRDSLRIRCEGGYIQEVEANGVFAPIKAQLTPGQSSQFQFPLSEIDLPLVPPPGHEITSIDGGGGTVDEDLSDTAVEVGCSMVTGIADGFDQIDTSAPRGDDMTLGFAAGLLTSKIAQEFTIPGSAPMNVGPFTVLAYQAGMPTTLPPSVSSVVTSIYDGPPWLPASTLLTTHTASGSDLEADWVELDRASDPDSDDGSMGMMELQVGCPGCLGDVLPPGRKWLVVSITGDPNYGPIQMPPCPYSSADDNAWGYNAMTGQWAQLRDAGSNRPVRFPIDIFAGDPDTSVTTAVGERDGDSRGIRIRVLPARPNPFLGQTDLIFELQREGVVSAEIFDIQGRSVRRLGGRGLAPGRSSLQWDGRDTKGRALPGGIFRYRVVLDGRPVGEGSLVRLH